MLHPFFAAFYSEKNRAQLSELAVTDLDTAEHLWGGPDSSRAFRNVLVGTPERRGEIWQTWITNAEMELAGDPLLYVLHNRQEIAGNTIDRWALYAALDIQEPQLFIHEDVLPEGVERARQGTEACESDMAPIFVGCEESNGAVFRAAVEPYCQARKPLLEFSDLKTGSHKVWPLQDASLTRQVSAIFAGAPLFVLDGHHRLAAAKENHRLSLSDGRILVCICSMSRSDTLILPIHRVVRYERWTLPEAMFADIATMGGKLRELRDVTVQEIAGFLESHESKDPYCVVLHSYADRPWLVTLPCVEKLPKQLARLAVSCLDVGVLGEHSEATSIPVPSLELALEQLALDQAQVAFFLPAASPAEVRAIALARMKMPRKSTRFVPKPVLGLLCRPWMNSG